MVRNPVDLCVALYEKRREMLQEDQPSFEQAWKLDDERNQGRHLPHDFRKV